MQKLQISEAFLPNYIKINSDASLMSTLKNIPDTQVASIAVCIQKFNSNRALIAVTHRQYPILPEKYYIEHKKKHENSKTPHFERVVETIKSEIPFNGIFQVEALGLIEALRCTRAEVKENPTIKKIEFVVDNKSLADSTNLIVNQKKMLDPSKNSFREMVIIQKEYLLLREASPDASIKITFKHREYNKEADRNAGDAMKFALAAVNSISQQTNVKNREDLYEL